MESGLEIATDYIRSIVMPSSTELPMRLAVRQEGTVDHVTVVTKEQTIFKTSFAVRRLKIDDTLTPSWDELWTNSRISTEPSDVFAVRNGVAVVDGSGTINVLDYSNGSFTRTLLGQLNKAKLLGIFRANREEIMLCYPGNGIYIKTGNKLSKGILRSHKMISWELSWKGAAFVPPFVFGMDENFVEIRNVCTGALVQIIKVEGAIFLPSSPEIRDVRADFYREWETREKHDNVLTEDMHFELRKWGPVIVTNSRIVQLAPRLHPETLDPSFFDVVINL
ncbi:hypothetical protein SCHPADRAFT_336306 [Schizopora paradoxa]|uniref:CNH domain-containing protein n=1 Tax=Schizopora paradoxa TaxID=27342 RepID=A0A0H2RX85_9AGAM|nr:hypothetical protein SCHPADRAFT_336306 [Schizopora paradoxa]